MKTCAYKKTSRDKLLICFKQLHLAEKNEDVHMCTYSSVFIFSSLFTMRHDIFEFHMDKLKYKLN